MIAEPIRGIVLSSYRELGDTMNYGGELQAGDGAADIAGLADTDDMRGGRYQRSQHRKIRALVTFVSDAYADKRFDASLVKVYPIQAAVS